MQSVLRLKPNQYAHILDNNTLITRVIVGPITFTKQDHENLVAGPANMVNVPPRAYCRVKNPVVKHDGKPVVDAAGQVKVRFGFHEIRFEGEPFPLYPGEELVIAPTPLTIVKPGNALRIRAAMDFTGDDGAVHITGDEWLFRGPGTYVPRVEEDVIGNVEAILVKVNEAIVLRATNDFTGVDGVKRIAGDKWLYRKPGAYLPDTFEEKIDVVQGYIITPTTAVHVVAMQPIKSFGKQRRAGEHWLITLADTDLYIPEIEEHVVEVINITTLSIRQFCVVLDPVDPKTGVQRFGARELRKGEASFFLNPGERLLNGIEDVYVLGEEEALLIKATSEVVTTETDAKGAKKTVKRQPGERWLLYGPCEYIPQIEEEVIEIRTTLPLGENEGVYVRNITTGTVRSVIGQSYMLKENEELWEKKLTHEMEEILSSIAKQGKTNVKRIPSRVISYQVPDNHAVQAFDYRTLKSRIIFGPELVLLEPDELFTILSLSGGVPKQKCFYTTIGLFLGPDFINDTVVVDTCDHARLSVKLSYSWRFVVDRDNQEEAKKMFYNSDFVGDVCRIVGSKVRGVVATTPFDTFHKNSADIVREAIFGKDGTELLIESNNLLITGVDVQSAEPVDQSTRDSLIKSVQLAIEITTKSQEANARHEAERLDQESKSVLERKGIEFEARAESSKRQLLEIQAANAAVESSGAAIGEAKARAAAARIEGEAAVEQAKLIAESKKIEFEATFNEEKQRALLEEQETESLNSLEISKAQKEAEIEVERFKQMVDAITPETIQDIAQAGPEMQAKLLGGLGMQSLMITDGNTPINLFNTAQGLVGSKAQIPEDFE